MTTPSPIHAHDYVSIVCRNFFPFQWAAAYEGLAEGVRLWNERYAHKDQSPGGFLLTICRRRVYDAYRAGKLVAQCRADGIPTVRNARRQKELEGRFPWITFQQTVDSDSDNKTGVMRHPTCDDTYSTGVIDSLDDQGFMDSRDDIDFQIIRMLVAGTTVREIALSLSLSTTICHRRITAMRSDFHAWQRASSYRCRAAGSTYIPTQRKRADADERPPPASRDASPAEPRIKAGSSKKDTPVREPWT